ncbi:hypothetical protein [Caproiciproducens sp.]|uniref:hypothetical protein n=1 Tax=Caproiciproducens sp. TaxID=1954376 RepID=UPI0028A2BF66|nr:hypothetical protein [Caproiciproducens sp.]
MLSFNKKYLIQKCLTGATLIMLGCANIFFSTSRDWLFYLFLALYAFGMLWSIVKKAEPEDERAAENIRKAKSHLYDLFLILVLFNAIFAHWNGKSLELTGELVLIMFGILQFGEYLYFLKFEKSNFNK